MILEIELTPRELATIKAALRDYARKPNMHPMIHDEATAALAAVDAAERV
jgi:hypothetical protein